MLIQIEDKDFMALMSKLQELNDENKMLKFSNKELFNRNRKLRDENAELKAVIARESEGKTSGWYFYGI